MQTCPAFAKPNSCFCTGKQANVSGLVVNGKYGRSGTELASILVEGAPKFLRILASLNREIRCSSMAQRMRYMTSRKRNRGCSQCNWVVRDENEGPKAASNQLVILINGTLTGRNKSRCGTAQYAFVVRYHVTALVRPVRRERVDAGSEDSVQPLVRLCSGAKRARG